MARIVANLVYQDFDPFFEWSEDETSATLTVMLPGFTKEQLRVQVTSTPVLRINGERQIFENKRRRFSKEFSIPPYCDTNDVNAKFDGGVLSIRFPKLITPAKPQPEQIPTPQKEKEAAQQDEVDKKELPPQKEKEPTSHEKEENKKESAEKENETISDDKEKNHKAEEKVAPKDVAQKKVPETAQEGTTTKDVERAKQKITQRLKTRVLDFTVSLRSADQDHQGGVKKGFCVGKCAKLIKRPKIWMNIVVAILLVMVLGLYVKNAFRSSSQGGTNQFEEF